jgi:hypothetical protein
MNIELLRQLLCGIISTHLDEISCGECLDRMDRYAELTLGARGNIEAMPLVHDHLARCRDCRQEFDALLEAIQAVGLPPAP